jgi:hypothetical protein
MMAKADHKTFEVFFHNCRTKKRNWWWRIKLLVCDSTLSLLELGDRGGKLQIFIYDSNYNLEQGKFDKIVTIIICNNCDLISWRITLLHTTSFENHNYEIQGPPWKLAIFIVILYDICPNLANINLNKVMLKIMKLCNMVR